MLPLSILGMLPAIEKSDNIVGELGAVVVAVECIALIMTVFIVERALAKKFDEDGNEVF